VISLIQLRSQDYSTHSLRQAFQTTSKLFTKYPYPDLYIKVPKDYAPVATFSEISLFDLIIDCIHCFLKYPVPEVIKPPI